jgi:class 3 adenylate cyclase
MNLLKRIDLPGDTAEDKVIKRVGIGVAYASSLNIVFEGTIAGYFGNSSGQYFLYIFASFFLIVPSIFIVTGFYKTFVRVGLYGGLFFQAGGQFYLGGFASSGGFIGWGLVTILCSVIAFRSREKFIPAIIYIFILISLGIFDSQISLSQQQIAPIGSLLLFINLFVTLGLMVFLMFNVYLTALNNEKSRSEALLLNILPKSIATRLKDGEETIADSYEEVTVLFTDMVGFTPLSESLEPAELVKILNAYFSVFDRLTGDFDIEKIKTIGDAYFAVAGLPEKKEDHAHAMAGFALKLLEELKILNSKLNVALNLRIGMHSGQVVAGVIGRKKFTFDLWGDTVNTASRMESHGIPGEIQVSEQTYELLKETHVFEARGKIDVKGKGLMRTYFLKERL